MTDIEKQIEKEMLSMASIIETFTTVNLKPIKLEQYQREMVNKPVQQKVVIKSRRIGYSTVESIEKLMKAHLLSNYTCYFISYNREEAQERIRIAKMAWEAMPDKVNGNRIKKKKVTDNKTSLEFLDYSGKSTSRLISFPCRELRGAGGDVVLDEMAFYRKSKEIYVSALPVIAGGHALSIGSTPIGRKGTFYELLTEKERYPELQRTWIYWWECTRLCVNIEEAKKSALYMSTDERVNLFGSAELIMFYRSMYIDDFKQEFECEFVDGSVAFISYELIRSCMPEGDNEHFAFKTLDEFLISYDKDIHGLIYAGFDVGRKKDASELFLIGKVGDMFYTWLSLTLHKVPFEEQRDILRKLIKTGIVIRLCGDETGMGMDIMETMRKEFSYLVEPVTFTPEMKEKMSNNLYSAFEKKILVLPNDKELFRQIYSVRRVVTQSRYARFDVDDDKAHADKYWALALAYYAWSGNRNMAGMEKYYDKQLADMGMIKKEKGYELKNDDDPAGFLERIKDFYKGGEF